MSMEKKLILLAVLAFLGCARAFRPQRAGELKLTLDNPGVSDAVTGVVFLLNQTAVYIRGFSYVVTGEMADFCAGNSTADTSDAFILDFRLNESDPNTSPLPATGFQSDNLELSLPVGRSVAEVAWFGLCRASDTASVLASVVILPDIVSNVPCNTTLIGELPSSVYGTAGRVYLQDRLTFAVIAFSYDGEAPDVFFWVGSGVSPSITGFACTYGDGIDTPLNALEDQDVVVHVPRSAEGTEINHFALYSRSDNVGIVQIPIEDGLIPFLPPLLDRAVFIGSLAERDHDVSGDVFRIGVRTLIVTRFNFDGEPPATFFYAIKGSDVNSPDELWRIPDEGGSTMALGATVNRTVVLTLPGDLTLFDFDFLSIWCDTADVNFGEVPIPAIERVLIGSLSELLHDVSGTVYALGERTLMITDFNFDGDAPATVFYAIRGPSVNSHDSFWVIPDESGSTMALGPFVDTTLILTLPDEITLPTIDFISVWCVTARVNFGDVQIPGGLQVPADGDVEVPTLPPIEECQALDSQVVVNCKQFHDDVAVSWVLDMPGNAVTFQVCGCAVPDDYIAFGISGSDDSVFMVGGDVTWTWLDDEGVHASDLDITARAQCSISSQNGVCPDPTDDVSAVSGFRDGCTTCIRFTRPIIPSDPGDKPFLVDEDQFMIWAIGPVGRLQTPMGIIPVPFQHDLRADPSSDTRLNLSRTPVDECNLQCSMCEVVLQPWPRPVLEHTTTISAQIGPSGGVRGYAGIAGTSAWGIAWYLNGLLIPKVKVFRNTTYTFTTEGGNDPGTPAKYHPFYITDDPRGGYLAKSPQDKQQETIYAGFDGSTPLGEGRLCEYKASRQTNPDVFDTFNGYAEALELECREGAAGTFSWTPDESTPDTVYYQCATHQFLGFTMEVVDGTPPTETPPTETPTPPTETPPETERPDGNSGYRPVGSTLLLALALFVLLAAVAMF